MRILDIINSMWAMDAGRLDELQGLYYAHTRHEKADLKAWEAITGRPQGSEREPYQLKDGVAVIPIQGVMTKVDSAWNRICGMTSTALVQQDLQAALDDPQVHSVLLWIDSPGGMVDGTQELADAVFAARSQKPILALGDGCMCSAAIWVGAAAEQVFITSDTTLVGSVGVVTSHTDISQQEAQAGRKTKVLTSGRFKAIDHQHAPLSQEGEAYIQARLDYLGSIFVDSIAKFRGVSVDTVLADMADGRVFLGQQAVEAGLVDGVSTMANLIAQLNQERTTWSPSTPAAAGASSASSTTSTPENDMDITRDRLAAEAPELLTALQAEGEAKGSAAEMLRVKGCLDAGLPGYEAMAMAFALDGKTTPGEASLAIGAKHKADLQAAHADAVNADKGAKPLPTAGDPEALDAAVAAKAKEEKDTKEGPAQAEAHATDIRNHIAAEAIKGRTITAAQASAELARKGKE